MVVLLIKEIDLPTGYVLENTSWFLSTTKDFLDEDIIYSSIEDPINLTSINISINLELGRKYYAKSRVVFNKGFSTYSNIEVFEAQDSNTIDLNIVAPSEISRPEITVDFDIKNAPTGLLRFNISEIVTKANVRHLATTHVLEDIDGKTIWSKINDKVNLNVLDLPIVLEDNKVYRYKASILGNNNNSSQFANLTFKTANNSSIELLTPLNSIPCGNDLTLEIKEITNTNSIHWSLYLDNDLVNNYDDYSKTYQYLIDKSLLLSDRNYILKVKVILTNNNELVSYFYFKPYLDLSMNPDQFYKYNYLWDNNNIKIPELGTSTGNRPQLPNGDLIHMMSNEEQNYTLYFYKYDSIKKLFYFTGRSYDLGIGKGSISDDMHYSLLPNGRLIFKIYGNNQIFSIPYNLVSGILDLNLAINTNPTTELDLVYSGDKIIPINANEFITLYPVSGVYKICKFNSLDLTYEVLETNEFNETSMVYKLPENNIMIINPFSRDYSIYNYKNRIFTINNDILPDDLYNINDVNGFIPGTVLYNGLLLLLGYNPLLGKATYVYDYLNNSFTIIDNENYRAQGDVLIRLLNGKIMLPGGTLTYTDVIFTKSNNTLISPSANNSEYFGNSVSISESGNILAVGIPEYTDSFNSQGCVIVYQKSVLGDWTQRNIITASSPETEDLFGYSVVLSKDGNTLFIGAPGYDGSEINQGAVYIYDYNGENWIKRGLTLLSSDPLPSEAFGISLSVSDDKTVLLVGAPGRTETFSNQGVVYIYDFNSINNIWTQRGDVITSLNPVENGYFGNTVFLDDVNSVIYISALNYPGSLKDIGIVYSIDLYDNKWDIRGEEITTPNTVENKLHGMSIGLSGDGSIMVNSALNYPGSNENKGCVYTYIRNSDNWDLLGNRLLGPSDINHTYFGTSLALSGDANTLAVSALINNEVYENKKCIFTYSKVEYDWVRKDFILNEIIPDMDLQYGISLSLNNNGTVLVVSGYEFNGNQDEPGFVFTYDLIDEIWVKRGETLLPPIIPDFLVGYFGNAVSLSGDANTLIVTAFLIDNQLNDIGVVFTYDLVNSIWVLREEYLLSPEESANDYFGISASISKDGNSLAIGTLYWNGVDEKTGAIYYYVNENNIWKRRKNTINAEIDYFGVCVSLNNNGETIIVSGHYPVSQENISVVYILDKSEISWVMKEETIQATNLITESYFGKAIEYDRENEILLISAMSWKNSLKNQGGYFQFTKVNDVWKQKNIKPNIELNPKPGNKFSSSLSFSNASKDLVLGTIGYDGSFIDQGIVYFYTQETSTITEDVTSVFY